MPGDALVCGVGEVILLAVELTAVMYKVGNSVRVALVRHDTDMDVVSEDNDVARLPFGGVGHVARQYLAMSGKEDLEVNDATEIDIRVGSVYARVGYGAAFDVVVHHIAQRIPRIAEGAPDNVGANADALGGIASNVVAVVVFGVTERVGARAEHDVGVIINAVAVEVDRAFNKNVVLRTAVDQRDHQGESHQKQGRQRY